MNNKLTSAVNINNNSSYIGRANTICSSINIDSYSTSKIKIPETTDIEIGDDSLDSFISKKIDAYIGKNLSKIVTSLPTDQNIKQGQFLIIRAEVGDMPKEQVLNYLKSIKKMFEEQGLTKVIIYPTYNGQGELTYDRLDVEDKFIE